MKWYITLFTAMVLQSLFLSGCEAPCGGNSSTPRKIKDWDEQPGTITCVAPGSNTLLYQGKFKKIMNWRHHDGYKTHTFLNDRDNVVVIEGFCVTEHIPKEYEKAFYEDQPKPEASGFKDPF